MIGSIAIATVQLAFSRGRASAWMSSLSMATAGFATVDQDSNC